MRGKRSKTGIVVKVLDLSKVGENCLKDYNEKHPDDPATSVQPGYEWGVVEVNGKVFALNTEGVGPEDQITKKCPLEVELYVSRHLHWEHMFPEYEVKLTDDKLLALPALREEPLETFIRTFGRRLEENFRLWVETLQAA